MFPLLQHSHEIEEEKKRLSNDHQVALQQLQENKAQINMLSRVSGANQLCIRAGVGSMMHTCITALVGKQFYLRKLGENDKAWSFLL